MLNYMLQYGQGDGDTGAGGEGGDGKDGGDNDLAAKVTALETKLAEATNKLTKSEATLTALQEQRDSDLFDPDTMKELLETAKAPVREEESKINWETATQRDTADHILKTIGTQLEAMEGRFNDAIANVSATTAQNRAEAMVDKLISKHNLDVNGELYGNIVKLSRVKPGLTPDDYYNLATLPGMRAKLSKFEAKEQEDKEAAAKRVNVTKISNAGGAKVIENIDQYKGDTAGIQKMAEDLGL
jgi:hypothetical protein